MSVLKLPIWRYFKRIECISKTISRMLGLCADYLDRKELELLSYTNLSVVPVAVMLE